MKYLFVMILLWPYILPVYGQKQTYDIVTYTEPAKWEKQVAENGISYTSINQKTKSWCRITLTKSTTSKGTIEADFESEWQEFIAKNYQPVNKPAADQVKETGGWKIKAGSAKFIFNNKEATAMLTTASGYARCTSIIAVSNSQDYKADIQTFLAAVSYNKPQTATSTVITNKKQDSIGGSQAKISTGSNVIVGSWGKSNTVSQAYNRFGTYSYNKQQYTFHANGTYTFNAKNYSEQYNETLLIKETGSYTINGNTLTIAPTASVIEAWSKKNGGDNWNQLKTSQKRKLEAATYQFSIVSNNLQLQIATATERDGSFNSGNTYSYGPPGTFTPIKLPGE